MKKTLEKYVLKPFLAGAFAASLMFTPLNVNEPYNVLAAQGYAQEVKKDDKLEELLSREENITSRSELRGYLEYSFELYDQERWDDCIELNKRAIELCEGSDESWFWYAYHNISGCYFNRGDYEEALVWMDKSEKSAIQGEHYGVLALVYHGKALILYKLGSYESALEYIDNSLSIYSERYILSPDGWYAKALILRDYAKTFDDPAVKETMLSSALEAVKKSISEYQNSIPRGNEEWLKNGLEYSKQLESEIEGLLEGLG